MQTTRASIVIALAAALAASASARAAVVVGGNVQSHSPDFRRIEVNGVLIPNGVQSGWGYFDWGDGTRTTGYFPTTHRYEKPGQYTIRVVGFNDLGETAEESFQHVVPPWVAGDVARVAVPQAATFAGLKELQEHSAELAAYDAQGNLLPLACRTIELYAPATPWFNISRTGNRIDVAANDTQMWDARSAWAYAYVDGVEIERPIYAISNRNGGAFIGVGGSHSGMYLPASFFTQASPSPSDQALAIDLAYAEFAWAVRHESALDGAPQIQGISYAPPIYGANGEPLMVGDTAGPTAGVPRFDILFHEMGHNFQSRRMLFLGSGIASGALYQETLAEWHVQFGVNRILANHAAVLSEPLRDALVAIRDDNRAYHAFEYQNYLNGGMAFNFNTIMPSHVLVHKIYELCDAHGWAKLRNFYDQVDVANMDELSEVYGNFGGSSDVRRLSALIAALGLGFGQDLRPVFGPLNFPIDSAFHDAVWQALARPIAPGDFDADEDVDAADLARWKAGYATTSAATSRDGDAEADGDVDGNDFLAWQRNLGAAPSAQLAQHAVPEPTAVLLAALSALVLRAATPRPRGATGVSQV